VPLNLAIPQQTPVAKATPDQLRGWITPKLG
jgi:hypothetical protein